MREYDDMLPVSLMNDHNREVFILVDRHNDHVADFNWARDDHECQRIVELINTNDAALRRAKVEGMREAGKIARANAELLRPPSRQFELNMVNKAKSEEAGMIADEIDARAAQIEEGE